MRFGCNLIPFEELLLVRALGLSPPPRESARPKPSGHGAIND